MAKQAEARKKRGRPRTTGTGVQVGTRWQTDQLKAIEAWAGRNGATSRADAIRQLVEIALSKSELVGDDARTPDKKSNQRLVSEQAAPAKREPKSATEHYAEGLAAMSKSWARKA